MREEYDGYRAHLAMELHEDIPAHVEARIADVRDFPQRSSSTRVPAGWNMHAREHCEMFAAALREEAHRELISVEGSSASRQAHVQEELVRARHREEHSTGLWRIETGECSRAGSYEARGCGGPLSVLGGSGTRQRPCSC